MKITKNNFVFIFLFILILAVANYEGVINFIGVNLDDEICYAEKKKDNSSIIKGKTVQSSAKSLCVIDSLSKRKLYCKDECIKLPMASTTKIVTALTVLKNCKELDKEFVIDERSVGISGTSIYLKKDETMTVRELLYGLMLVSGNDAATALAYHIGGTLENFCNMMNKTAESVGAYNSHFENPHGLDSPGHYTTAYDLALITSKALENNMFKEIVSTKSTRIRGCSVGTYRYLKNKNKLLNTLEDCVGVKTGFTNKAGRCFVGAVKNQKSYIVSVILNCGPMFEECERLTQKAKEEYTNYQLLKEYKVCRKILVNNGRKQFIKTFTKNAFCFPLTSDEKQRVVYEYDLPNCLEAPLYKEQVIGTLNIYLDNCLLFSEKIYTIDSVKKVGVWSSIEDIISKW